MSTVTATKSETPTRRAAATIFALALGGFTIGTTEFVTMGVLPQIAAGLHVSEPDAAHGISAYALGVIVGVPLLAIAGARLPRREFLIALMSAYGLFNLFTAVSVGSAMFTIARFLDGLPNGAFFGIASLVAADLVPAERRGRAIASVLLGLSVANVIGVPAASWLGENLGWRIAFLVSTGLAILTIALLTALVPSAPASSGPSGFSEARTFFSRGQVWLTLAAGSIGFGGLFAIYSYIATTVTDISGLPASTVPLFLLAFGLGLTVGTPIGGELARWSIFGSLVLSASLSAILMVVFWITTPVGWWSLPVLFLITAVGSVFVTNLQLRLMQVAGDAVTLGAAMNQAALNISNALGAWLGGVVIAAGLGYRLPALIGAGMAVIGVLLLLASDGISRLQRRTASTPAVAA